MTVFLTEMKLIQEIRLELVSLDPFSLCKYVLRWFLKKKIHPPSKNPPSAFIGFSKKIQPPRLFQPPRLLILPFLHPLHVHSNLHAY
jgi:hypothetical protein